MVLQMKVSRELSHCSVHYKHNPSEQKIHTVYLPGHIRAAAEVDHVCGPSI